MRNMASLLSKPMTPAPPDDGAAGGEPAGSGGLQSLMGSQGGQQPGGGPAPPSEQHMAAMLDHLGAFQREWMKILQDPGAGKKDIKGAFMEGFADLMGEGYITLAQAMSLLKDLPTTPLEQKQWAQEHLQKDEKATRILLQQAAVMNPQTGFEPNRPIPQMKSPRERNHPEMMRDAMKFYDHHNASKRKR